MREKQQRFLRLYEPVQPALTRYLRYKIADPQDGEDVLQEVLAAAYASLDSLTDEARFRPWLLSIASHKCLDYYRRTGERLGLPLELLENTAEDSRGNPVPELVADTLARLKDRERQILYLFYLKGYSQKDISTLLGIPLGTVKSRICTAKSHFRRLYPCPPRRENTKGAVGSMLSKTFPERCPDVTIERLSAPPFSVRFEEITGWLFVPRVGEKSSFGFYDDPTGCLTGIHIMEGVRPAQIHGIPCVQTEVEQWEKGGLSRRTLFLRLTETHCFYVAEMAERNGCLYFGSFMDDEWLARYEVGENNSGRPVEQRAKGIITAEEGNRFTVAQEETADIFGRYRVTIGGRCFDTVALAESENGLWTIQYLNREGRTVLFRRYNRDDWKQEQYGQPWSQKLPDSEIHIVNGQRYVHWYDCLPETVL